MAQNRWSFLRAVAVCCVVALAACGGGGGGVGGTDESPDAVGDGVIVDYGVDQGRELTHPDPTPEPAPDQAGEEGMEAEPAPEAVEPGAEAAPESDEPAGPEEATEEAAEDVPPEGAPEGVTEVIEETAPEADAQAEAAEEVAQPRPVDWCRLQWPIELTVASGVETAMYGRVFVEGVTDLTDGVDQHPDLSGQFGYGPDGSDPTGEGWTWIDALANQGWSAAAAGEPGNDEYIAAFTAGAGGTYDMAWRFTADGGQTWTYCDRDAGEGKDGSEDGYAPENAGVLIVTDPCHPNPCVEPPVAACVEEGGRYLKTYEDEGTCTIVDGEASCDYGPSDIDCWAESKVCSGGACDDPCDPNPCTTPDPATCAEDGRHVNGWEPVGICALADGQVGCTYQAKVVNCEDTLEVCENGACVAPPDPCDPNPCTEPPEPTCDAAGKVLTSYPPLGTCTPDYLTPVCDYAPFTIDCTGEGKVCVDGACLYPTPAAAGDLVVTEFMARSQGGTDPGEWFEVRAADPSKGFDLRGCTLTDAKEPHVDLHVVSSSVPVAPGAYVVLAKSDDPVLNHGLEFDYVYADFNLSNTSDDIVIMCGDTLIDRAPVAATPSWLTGVSVQLEPGKDAVENDDAANWCWSIPTYGTAGKHGTPRAENPACRRAVDWCRFQHPLDTVVPPGGSVTVYGRFTVAGVTDLTDGIDEYLPIRGEVGRGPDGSTPPDGWTWTAASPTPGWSASAQGDPGRDEYTATLTAPVGVYDLAFRFSLDGGATWTYCDGNAGPGHDGSEDGYSAANAAAFVVDDPCVPNPCTDAGPDTCDASGRKVVSHVLPGTCTPEGLAAQCAYTELVTACAPYEVCKDGACDDPCVPNPCTDPPPPICDPADPTGVTLLTYPATGNCALEGLEPACTYTPTITDCSDTGRVCQDGACFGEEVVQPSAAGQVVITEFMARADTGQVHDGEWFELYNASDKKLELAGCVIGDDGTDHHEIGGSLAFGPGERLVLAASADPAKNHGVPYDYIYSGFTLANEGDEIVLSCGGVVIDRVAWPDGHVVLGAAQQFEESSGGAEANDDMEKWCVALGTYGTDNRYGSPGAANPPCKWNVDWCRYQHPPALAGIKGVPADDAYGWVLVTGVTDRTNGPDALPALVGQVGYGPDGSDPAAGGWRWFDATPNPSFSNVVNDEYAGKVVPEAAGTFDVAYRFSLTGGRKWVYCDRDMRVVGGADGSADGYQVENSASMVATDPCDPNPCVIPPPAECKPDGVTLVSYMAPGACTATAEGGFECEWTSMETDCSVGGMKCRDGACQMTVVKLLFSEYVEGSSNNKAVEVYNAGSDPVALKDCQVIGYNNGANTQTYAITLADTSLAPGDVWVLCHSSAGTGLAPLCDQLAGLNFNGDDAIELRCGVQFLDYFGQIGLDPGTEWGTGLTSTADNTLRRKCSVTGGDVLPSDAFDPSVEWEGFATDTFDGLGARGCP